MTYRNLSDVYSHLRPIDSSGESLVTPRSTVDVIDDVMMSPQCRFRLYATMHETLSDHVSKADDKDKEEMSRLFHMIGPRDPGPVDFGDKDYFEGVKSVDDFVPALKDEKSSTPFVASMFVSRHPYVTPARRGTGAVDFFLNYVPNTFASQMVPYLDVEMQILKESAAGGDVTLNTPSIMRFLMGSRRLDDGTLAPIDVTLAGEVKKQGDNVYAYTGMENFLAPQSLTNMDDIERLSVGDDVVRLVRAKPFVPFGSIEGFDVTIQNAGAGMYASRRASLKIKIHDKSRISEMSEFIRGSPGFTRVHVWTTYGWLAPTGRGDDDEYAKFVNENMMIRDCWFISNSQFSFDGSGQAIVNLDMMNAAAKTLRGIHVSAGDDATKKRYDDLRRLIEELAAVRDKYSSNPKFVVDTLTTQVINEASSGGMSLNVSDADFQKAVVNLTNSLRRGGIDKDVVKEFSDNLKNVKTVGKAAAEASFTSAQRKFANLGSTPDPFLPTDSSPKRSSFFPDTDLVKAVNEYRASNAERAAAIAEKDKGPASPDEKKGVKKTPRRMTFGQSASVVSFGKLFMEFVAPAVKNAATCDELQVFFYGLNDKCGPASGHSIAEFPINVAALSQAYADALRTSQSDDLTLEAFMRLVIETQFSDRRAIGYGMNRFYKPFDPDKPSEEQVPDGPGGQEAFNQNTALWISKYGELKLPVIELYPEAGEEGTSSEVLVESLKLGSSRVDPKLGGPRKIIKRIHIYDKQNNPYRLMQTVISSDDGRRIELGDVDGNSVSAKARGILKGFDAQKLQAIKKILETGKESYAEALKKSGVKSEDIDALAIVDRPGGERITLPRDRRALKEALMRFVPTIVPGTNGSLVSSINIASKTDGLTGMVNLNRSVKGSTSGKPTMTSSALEESDGLPMNVIPAQLTMSSLGVPLAQLYQTFFFDLGTGTTLDNLYLCTLVQHSISKGRFTTSWTFSYVNGYSKFVAPPGVNAIVSGKILDVIDDVLEAATKSKSAKKK